MDILSPVPIIVAIFAAVATIYLIVKLLGSPSVNSRFSSIDGLRGYLAFFVYLHHSCIWYFYIRTGRWEDTSSNLYTHLGQSSVALFFMITGFLFFSKLIDARIKGIDWGRMFISRFMRLVPLYLFAMCSLFIIVFVLSGGELNEPLPILLKGMAHWLGFTIFDAPDLNNIGNTKIIIAAVTWSLPYEWFFYFSLPLLALFVRVIPSIPYLMLGIASVVLLMIWNPQVYNLLSFLGGIVAAILVRWSRFCSIAVRSETSFLILIIIALVIIIFPTAYGVVPILMLSLVFSLIAGGNTMFKILVSPVSCALGEMAYSIYLLHGIILFMLFNLIIGLNNAKELSPMSHWLLIICVSPILILVCYCTFRFIESPAMRSTNSITLWLRSSLLKIDGFKL